MTLDEIIADARRKLDDKVEPYLYSDEDLYEYANNAVAEACLRTRSIIDSSSSVTQFTLEEGVTSYRLDPSIFAVRTLRIEGETRVLARVNTSYLDEQHPGWDDESGTLYSAATPTHACFNRDQGYVSLFPPPAEADDGKTVYMKVWRGPTDNEKLEGGGDEPPLPLDFHRDLVQWILHECFSQKDSEREDLGRADRALALFTQRFGERPSNHMMKLWSCDKLQGTKSYFT